MKDVDLAYLAGLIDGEGSIFLSKSKSPTASRGYRFQAYLKVTNNDPKIVSLVKQLPGNWKVDRRTKNRLSANYVVYLHSLSDIWTVLELLRPFLVLKKELADLMSQWCRSRLERESLRLTRSARKYTAEEEILAEKIRESTWRDY